MQVIPPNAEDREAHRALMAIAKRLSDVEDAIKQAFDRYPAKTIMIREFISKVRCDLAFLDKAIAGSKNA